MGRSIATRPARFGRRWGAPLLGVAALGIFLVPVYAAAEQPKVEQAEAGGAKLLKADSRSPYVHRLTLYDHEGRAIEPAGELPPPYSPRMTCGKCHPYADISHGWHFNAPDPNVAPGRPGEPWFWVDERTGTVLPLSGRRWQGTYAPADIGLTNWQFVLRFGGHLPGGGFGDPSDEDVKKSREAVRWNISGRLEIDCLFCHSADQTHDPAEAARQIEKQNFKWAPTVALGLAAVRGEARKAPDDWDPTLPPNPDFPEKTGPKLVYDKARFDVDNRVFFNITRRVPVERCYFCHSFREVGAGAVEPLLAPRDVHLAAGLLCVDCHTNDISHAITRDYASEARQRGNLELAAFSCEGCHLGAAGSSDEAVTLGGRSRAPRPQHRGLPPVHFEKLTCTACHSGPWPMADARRIQTALAHGLGLATRDRTDTESPEIAAPIFARQDDGRIGTARLVWPRFWGRLDGTELKPLSLASVQKAGKGALPKPTGKEPAAAITPESTAKMLAALAADKQMQGTPVYVHNGRVYQVVGEGKLETLDHPAAHAYLWPLAHDVRPKEQSLGVRGCTDCHAAGTPIYAGRLAPKDDPDAAARPLSSMIQAWGGDPQLAQAWSLGFMFRPVFKWFAFTCAGLIALILLRFVLDLLTGRVSVAANELGGTRVAGLTVAEHLFHTLAILGIVIQAVSGLGPRLTGSAVAAWPLFSHMVGAPLLVIGLTGTALQWARRCQLKTPGLSTAQKWLFWIGLACGWAVLMTMLAAMVPVIGQAGQKCLVHLHRYTTIALVVIMIVHTLVSLAKRRARGRTQ